MSSTVSFFVVDTRYNDLLSLSRRVALPLAAVRRVAELRSHPKYVGVRVVNVSQALPHRSSARRVLLDVLIVVSRARAIHIVLRDRAVETVELVIPWRRFSEQGGRQTEKLPR